MCKGAVTWRVLGRALVDRTPPELVGQCELDHAAVLDADLREAIREMVKWGFVLVRNTEKPSGEGPPFAIITTADLALGEMLRWMEKPERWETLACAGPRERNSSGRSIVFARRGTTSRTVGGVTPARTPAGNSRGSSGC